MTSNRPATKSERPGTKREIPVPETTLPDGEEPASRCPHCDRPFTSESLRDLHVGEVHDDVAADGECEAYDAALEDERDALFLYQLKVTVVLGLTYSSSALILLFVLG